MAIQIQSNKSRKEDLKLLACIIAGFLFVVWLCTPPGNKFAQMCLWGNHTKMFIASIVNPDATTEYVFHRKNAMYLVDMKMYKNALIELDKALGSLPPYAADNALYGLYRDRGRLKMYLGDYKGAVDDFLRIPDPSMDDALNTALCFKNIGNNKSALTYCNTVVNMDAKSYAGFACIADVYAGVGKYDTAVRVFDLLIDRSPTWPKYYVERANYKKALGDRKGYEADIAKAKELSPVVDEEYSIIKDVLYPKTFKLDRQ